MKIRRFEGAVRLSGAAFAVAAWSWRSTSVSFAIIVGLSLSSQAADDPLTADVAERVVVPFLQRHCFDCHDKLSLEGGLDLQSPEVAFATREEIRFWTRVYDRVDRGEMPPADCPPSSLFRQLFVDDSPDEVRKQVQRLKDGQSICQIFVRMLQQLGVPAERFASGDRPVAGLQPV